MLHFKKPGFAQTTKESGSSIKRMSYRIVMIFRGKLKLPVWGRVMRLCFGSLSSYITFLVDLYSPGLNNLYQGILEKLAIVAERRTQLSRPCDELVAF